MTVPTMPKDVKDFTSAIANASGLFPEVVFAWMVAEDVKHLKGIQENHNPLNIRYTADDHKPWLSTFPQFREATGIQNNGVVVYDSLEKGIRATIAVLHLNYYLGVMGSDNQSPLNQSLEIEKSPWDAANYHGGVDDNNKQTPGIIYKLLQKWNFTQGEKPVVVESESRKRVLAAKDAITDLGDLWGLMDSKDDQYNVHLFAQSLRCMLVTKGCVWNEDKTAVTFKDDIGVVVV